MAAFSRSREHRRAADRFGRLAEWLCVLLLWAKFYRLLARRYRSGYGEIDLIAERFGSLAFIEVKARRTRVAGLESLNQRQRRRIGRAALAFLAENTKYALHRPRFDLMLVAPWRWPVHLPNAWQDE